MIEPRPSPSMTLGAASADLAASSSLSLFDPGADNTPCYAAFAPFAS